MVDAPVPAGTCGDHTVSNVPHFASSLSVGKDARAAVREALERLEAGLAGTTPDLVVAFATHHHGALLEELGPRLAQATGSSVVMGCTAESVIGGSQEIEGRPGLALWAAALPGTDVRYFEIQASAGDEDEPQFTELPPVDDPKRGSLILLADPFTFPIDPFLHTLNERLAGVPAMGGMASGALGPGQTLFFTSEGVRESGCVGVVLEGDIELRTVVSQGCRPVGKPWVITECEQNRIRKLAGRPALEILMETWHGLPSQDQRRLQSAPFLGLAIDAMKRSFERGDFLVRSIMGLDQRDRSITVADFVRRGQTVQLLVRDAQSAGEDLRLLMARQGGGALGEEAHRAGALIFSCNGRGSRMFDVPDHDIGCVREGLNAEVPVAGFFAAGEIGPVGGRNFLHGFTASVAVFRSRTPRTA